MIIIMTVTIGPEEPYTTRNRTQQRQSTNFSILCMFNLRRVNFDWLSCVFHAIFNGFNYRLCSQEGIQWMYFTFPLVQKAVLNIRESKDQNEHLCS